MFNVARTFLQTLFKFDFNCTTIGKSKQTLDRDLGKSGMYLILELNQKGMKSFGADFIESTESTPLFLDMSGFLLSYFSFFFIR